MKALTEHLTGPALNWVTAVAEGVPVRLFDEFFLENGRRKATPGDLMSATALLAYQPLRGQGCLIKDGAAKPIPAYSTDRNLGGEITDRERITIHAHPDGDWCATVTGYDSEHSGRTPLIAALRLHAARKLGDVLDVPDQLLHQPLSELFIAVLKRDVGDEKFTTICQLNLAETDQNICHSHDFVDANMTMLEAFETLTGSEIDIQDDAQRLVWNGAWALATEAMCEMAKSQHKPTPGATPTAS